MNDNRDTNPLPNEDDQTLGANLGAAIGRRSESLDSVPPVKGVIERSAAAASARRIRYTLVGVTAAAALLAGGLIAWNALRDDGNVHIATESTAPKWVEPAAEDSLTEGRDGTPSSGPAQPTAEDDTPTGPQHADPPAARPDDRVEETDETDSASTAPASDPPTPDELSTGPTLTWVEVALDTSTGFIDVYRLASISDGRIVARAVTWGDVGDRVVVTENGTNWIEVQTPTGFSPGFFDIAGDRWLLGEGSNSDLGHPPQAFFSENDGASWTEVAINIDSAATDPPSCLERLSVQEVLTSGDRIVVVIESDIYLDVPARLVALGYAPDTESILEWHGVGTMLVVHLGGSSNAETIEVPYDELIPALGEPRPCAAPGARSGERVQFLQPDRVRLLVDEGSGAEQVAEYAGWTASAMGTPDGFSVTILTDDGMLQVTSEDGRTWSETTLGFGYLNVVHDGSDTTWYSRDVNFTYGILRASGGERLRPVAIFDGLGPGRILTAGPAGIVITARPRHVIDLDTFDEPAVWIGWSADGDSWGWQTADDAFGIDTADGDVQIELAVGNDFVLARVELFDAADADPNPPRSGARWFIGRVP